jgi:conjugative transfer signal peptidase TraF
MSEARLFLHRQANWAALIQPLVFGVVAAMIVSIGGLLGFRVNVSGSEPLGIWRVHNLTSGIHRGDYVSFCAPVGWYPFLETGDCPNGAKPFLKQIAGVPGDRVEEDESGVRINGRLLKDSSPLPYSIHDHVALPQWRGHLTLHPDTYWVYGTGWPSRSFDSRYWGPLPGRLIHAIAQPVWVWNDVH